MGRRRQAREFALQALYLCESGLDVPTAITSVARKSTIDKNSLEFAGALVEGTISEIAELDAILSKTAENWSLARMASVDRNLLRLASYELLHCPETPPNVVIDEAVEIAKIYASGESSRFINGILDKIKKPARAAKTK